ncbi:unnamed protein product [Cuscuta campestris]|uniref:Uncharacterized protein n=1 Tax=Cuscuta campestris TaxID=132261 RepID=A0A484L530_9ASTE|nr:unnamed protein product [Cuscuta campestris]
MILSSNANGGQNHQNQIQRFFVPPRLHFSEGFTCCVWLFGSSHFGTSSETTFVLAWEVLLVCPFACL